MRRTFPAALVVLVLASVSARAHHSYPDFLLDQKVTVEGTLDELKYANPHAVLKIRTAEGLVYSAEWQVRLKEVRRPSDGWTYQVVPEPSVEPPRR